MNTHGPVYFLGAEKPRIGRAVCASVLLLIPPHGRASK